MISADELRTQLNELEASRAKVLADLNAHDGAIQIVTQLHAKALINAETPPEKRKKQHLVVVPDGGVTGD